MKKQLLLIICILIYNISFSQTKILFFEVVHKDKVYFDWEVVSDKKELIYIIQGSYDKINFVDIFTYKTIHKKYKTSSLCDYMFFRLKIKTTKDVFIFSDIVYENIYYPIKISPDLQGLNTVYVTTLEDGVCYIYNLKNEIMLIYPLIKGHNQVVYNLNEGQYFVKVFTETFFYEIKLNIK